MNKKYRDYFNIDPEYFPAVDEKLIDQGKVDWKKFFPHATFVSLLKNVVRVLERKDKLSLWVEGSYGTGKSHAVLTLKKLLDAPVGELDEYFTKYKLDKDLLNKFKGLKDSPEPILTVHRYGTSAIYGDRDLIFAVQESVKKALLARGIKNQGEVALKEAVLGWLQNDENRDYFNNLITKRFPSLFAGDTALDVIAKLNNYSNSDTALITLMHKIFKVADDVGITALKLDIDGLVGWLKNIIESNKLKAIVFIWDEFTEYFTHNRNSLTGFQRLAQMSATEPFYLCIVTHKSEALFDDADRDKNKILDRFVKPTCKLELPENIAFQLMGQALEKNDDPAVLQEWEKFADDLNDSLRDSRKLVKTCTKISDDELMGILPIHPYAALLLKHISSGYASDQRSMFGFIKNNRGEEIKGFQWFIDNYGPLDNDPLLTIDMLWDFFYEKGKNNLPMDVRSVLDTCPQYESKLEPDEVKVLRTLLLLQAISQRVGDSVPLFIPNEKNINNAYNGSELENGAAGRIAQKLVRDGILYQKPMGNNTFQFAAITGKNGIIDPVSFERYKKEFLDEKTSSLIIKGELSDAIALPPALAMRYVLKCVASDSLVSTINQLRNQENNLGNRILLVAAFAKNEEENASIVKLIREKITDATYHIHFVDTSATPLGPSALDQYAENMAYGKCYRGNDNKLADDYEKKAIEILTAWQNKIVDGEFTVYSNACQQGERAANITELLELLKQINLKKFPLCLESFMNVTETMFSANSLKQGVACGAREEVAGAFRSGNAATKLENALSDAWKISHYWEGAAATKPIGKIKKEVEEIIAKAFASSGRVSIKNIYDSLATGDYGVMPCNLTAFVLGFLLKEYANDTYQWSDDQTSDPMSVSKLQEMVDEIIKLQNTPNPRYKDKYIVAMTDEEKAFNECSSKVFDIPLDQCVSIEQTRNRIRLKMRDLAFPVWCVKNVLEQVPHTTDSTTLVQLIDDFSGVANHQNLGGGRNDTDIALEIGKICREKKSAIADIAVLLTKENCLRGMQAFLNDFDDGILPKLAEEVGDDGQYLNVIKKKFDADSANWVWNKNTAEQKIREVIIEYKILVESHKIGIHAASVNEVVKEWCDKARNIKISYEVVENFVDDAKPFLKLLVAIKRTGTLLDSQRKEFLTALETHLAAFQNFYNSQLKYFQDACKFYLDGLTMEEISDIFATISWDVFTKGKSEYLNIVQGKVDDFKKNQGKTKLRNLWRDKTGTNSPREWSQIHLTPILCMIPEDEVSTARAAFGTIHRNNPEPHDIGNAIAYLERATFFVTLGDAEKRNAAFMEKIIRGFSTMLTDPDVVRNYLRDKLTSEPYDWFGIPEVERKLKDLAQSKYDLEGSDKALAIIENMDEHRLKSYLKRLVKDNMIVGMEIIKDK
ncbi:MAG: hypothetical protein AB7F40_02305 [Victivallaceae bacterium]